MKTYIKSFTTIALLSLGTIFTFTQCEKDLHSDDMIAENYQDGQNWNSGTGHGSANNDPCNCLPEQYTPNSLSETETDALLFMREEEKLARDVYTFLYERWELPVFSNIAASESRHMEAIGCLITRYGLTDPVGSNMAGEFANGDLKNLYEDLTEEGSKDLIAALKVGATIEDLDIADLMSNLEQDEIDNPDVRTVFESLTKGSRNHLRAFNRLIEQQGASYTPQFISAELFDSIITSEVERGSGLCAGSNNCQGTGEHKQGSGNGDSTCDGTGQQHQGGGNQNGKGNGPNIDGNGHQNGKG